MPKKAVDRVKEARKLDGELRGMVTEVHRAWARIAKLCLKFRDEHYYKELGFERFDDWIDERLGRSKSYTYQMMQSFSELCGDVSDKDISDMSIENASLLAKVPTKKRKALVTAAKSEPSKTFLKTVQREVPDAHIEGKRLFQVWLEQSAHAVVEREMERAKQLAETGSRGVALEYIVSTAAHVFDNEAEAEKQEAELAQPATANA